MYVLFTLPDDCFGYVLVDRIGLTATQITCLYDMDIPRPNNFNETYLYEGEALLLALACDNC